MPLHLIVLAAGEGTRMASDTPKVMHRIAGAPMIAHTLATADGMQVGERVVVIGHKGNEVRKALNELDPDIRVTEQTERLGTAHAALTARNILSDATGDVAVMNGDNPLISPDTLKSMTAARAAGADLVILGFHVEAPNRYGRLIHDGDQVRRIVEWKDASEEERRITLCNAGVYVADVQMFTWPWWIAALVSKRPRQRLQQ